MSDEERIKKLEDQVSVLATILNVKDLEKKVPAPDESGVEPFLPRGFSGCVMRAHFTNCEHDKLHYIGYYNARGLYGCDECRAQIVTAKKSQCDEGTD